MAKKSKKIIKSYSSDHVTTILEDIQDQFKAFGEGQEILTEKVDEISERLIRVEDDVVEIKHRLSQKVDLDDFQKLEKRMMKLEKFVFAKLAG